MTVLKYYMLGLIIIINMYLSSSLEIMKILNDLRGGETSKSSKLQNKDLFQSSKPINDEMITSLETNDSCGSMPQIVYKTLLTGEISKLLKNLAIDVEKIKKIWLALQKEIHVLDVIAIGFVGWVIQPLNTFVRKQFKLWKKKGDSKDSGSKLSLVIDAMSEMSKIASLVYVIDVIDIILTEMGFEFAIKYELSHLAAKTFYTIWAGYKIKKFKYDLIQKEKEKHKYFPSEIINKVLNGVIYTISSLILLEAFRMPVGVALSSIFAFGGVGTLVFSLASKDFATELFSGIISSASNKYDLGDKIFLADGTNGYITRIGWYDMDVLGDDSLVYRIPYSQISKQSIVNISRNKKCQVKQTLRFQYKDMDIIHDILEDIKVELIASCPKLITDGGTDRTRPWRIFIYSFEADHISVVLNTHHLIRPGSNEHHRTRHDICDAVARVMKKYNTTFALPILTMNPVTVQT